MNKLTLPRLVIAITFIALFAMAVRTPVDTDMWWHLRAGQYIVQTGSIPHADPFSWTMHGKAWVDVYWLSQAILYITYASGGPALLALLVAVLVVVAFVYVWKQLEGPVFLRALIVILSATVAAAVWTPRGQMVTFVLTAVVSYILFLYKWKQVDRLWIMPCLFIIWANMHAGYIAGFMLMGTLLVGEAIQSGVRNADWRIWVPHPEIQTPQSELTWPRWRKLSLVALLSTAAVLVNPYTVDTLLLPFKTVGIGVLQDFIQEWASPNFHQLFLQPVIWMWLLTLALIGWSGRRLDVTDALTLSLFTYIVLLAQRNIGLFAIVCAPILSRHASALVDRSRRVNRSLSRGSPIVNALLIGLIALAALVKVAAALLPSTIDQAQRQELPVGAADWIVQHQPTGPMYNSYNWGGYLLWRLYPQYPVYVDGRTDLYDDAFLRNYLSIASVAPDYDQRLDQSGAQFAVIEANTVLDVFLSRTAAWHAAYRDPLAVIYVRTQS